MKSELTNLNFKLWLEFEKVDPNNWDITLKMEGNMD